MSIFGRSNLVDKFTATVNEISASCDRIYGVFKADLRASRNSAGTKTRTFDRDEEINTRSGNRTNMADGSHNFASLSEEFNATFSRSYDWKTKLYKNADFLLPASASADAQGVSSQVPIMRNTNNTSLEWIDSKDLAPWVRTLHFHLNKDQPSTTATSKCLLDSGSDLNLISQRFLHLLGLPLIPHEAPTVTGIGGIPVIPIGSVILTWHMDSKEHFRYTRKFWVISNDTPALFDVLLGQRWIKETKAFLRNQEI